MRKRKVNTVLIASGSGTDANAIMTAYVKSCIPNVNIKALLSTKIGAGCLDKAKVLGIRNHYLERKRAKSLDSYNEALANFLKDFATEMVFLVGCRVKVYPVEGVRIYNIHPADPHKHGGNNMHGLEVHRRVILEIVDWIARGKMDMSDKFYTLPTIHEATMEYDSGEIFLQTRVEVPNWIIEDYINSDRRDDSLNVAASHLQRHVLPYEWIMLPTAVEMAAKKIIDQGGD